MGDTNDDDANDDDANGDDDDDDDDSSGKKIRTVGNKLCELLLYTVL